MVKYKLLGFIIVFLGFSSSAVANTNCPDMQGSYTIPNTIDGGNRLIEKVDYWVVPTKAAIRSINAEQTLNNLAVNYPSKNKPSFTCIGTRSALDTCMTPSGVYFGPNTTSTAGVNIPSKNGDIVLVGSRGYDAQIVSTSCKKEYSLTYRLSSLYEVGKSNYPVLPYLLLERRTLPIKVQVYRAAPQF